MAGADTLTAMEADSDVPPAEKSTEEADQLARSTKKYKRHLNGEIVPQTQYSSPPNGPWGGRSFIDVVRQEETPKEIYVSDDEQDSDDDLMCGELPNELMVNEGENIGRISITVPTAECRELCRPWRRALIVKVLGRTVTYRILEQRLQTLWNLTKGCEIIDLEDGYYVVRFYCKEDYTRVVENGPWLIQGHYLTIMKWKPNFHPETNKITSTLAWVRLNRIPIEFFKEQVLLRIGDRLGKAIKVDKTTLNVERAKYARVCVEVDLTRPLTSIVMLNGRDYKVEYEGLHLICFECGKYGHKTEDCGANRLMMEHENAVLDVNGSQKDGSSTAVFGPWMVASNRKRRPPPRNNTTPMQPVPNASQFGKGYGGEMSRDILRREHTQNRVATQTGSRFDPLADDEGDHTRVFNVDSLRDQLFRVPDMGLGVKFTATTREVGESSKSKSKKGVPVKQSLKVRGQPKTGPKEVQANDAPNDQRATGVRVPVQRTNLRDVTNVQPGEGMGWTGKSAHDSTMLKPLAGTYSRVDANKENPFKQHPPDSDCPTDDTHVNLQELENTDDQGVSDVLVIPESMQPMQDSESKEGGASEHMLISS